MPLGAIGEEAGATIATPATFTLHSKPGAEGDQFPGQEGGLARAFDFSGEATPANP